MIRFWRSVVRTSVNVGGAFVGSFLDLEKRFVAFLLAFPEIRFVDLPSVSGGIAHADNTVVAASGGDGEYDSTEDAEAPSRE